MSNKEDEPLETLTRSHRAGRKREGENEIVTQSKKTCLSSMKRHVETESDVSEVDESGEVSDGYIDDSGDSEQDNDEEAEEGREGKEGERVKEENIEESDACYVPPHMRGRDRDSQRTAAMDTLQRTIQGLVNR